MLHENEASGAGLALIATVAPLLRKLCMQATSGIERSAGLRRAQACTYSSHRPRRERLSVGERIPLRVMSVLQPGVTRARRLRSAVSLMLVPAQASTRALASIRVATRVPPCMNHKGRSRVTWWPPCAFEQRQHPEPEVQPTISGETRAMSHR